MEYARTKSNQKNYKSHLLTLWKAKTA